MAQFFALIALVFSFSTAAFAQSSVVVVIDGKTFSCTEGAGVPGLPSCADRADALKKKYDACGRIYDNTTCFKQVYFTNLDKTCPALVDACQDACGKVYDNTTCYKACF